MKKPDTYYPDKILESSHEGLNLKDFWHTIVRRKRLILLFIAVFFLLSLTITLLMKPVYRASTLVEIERKIASITDSGFINGDDPRDTRDFYQTQYELIKSRSIASKVIKDLNLADDISKTGVIHQIKSLLHLNSDDSPDLEGIFIDNITIEPINTSRLVLLSYDADDPKVAANIVNAIAKTFIERNQNKYKAATQAVRERLEKQIDSVQKQLDSATDAVAKFKKDNDLVDSDESDSNPYQNIRELKAQHAEALRKKIALEAKLTTQEKQHPPKEYTNAINEEKSLRIQLERVKAGLSGLQAQYIRLDTLENNVDSLQTTLRDLKEKLRQVNIASSGSSRISIVDKAIPPKKKYKPKLLLNLLFGTFIGFLLGTAYAFLIEYLDDTITDAEELERNTKLPNLGIIPTVENYAKDKIGLLTYKEVHSHFAEAFRTFRTSIKFLANEAESRLMFITSTRSGEGKSTTASNLATVYAQSGRSVLLIDADLRNPSIHKIFNEEQDMGLSELLIGDAEPKDVIRATEVPDLYIITSGKFTHDPIGLISNLRMEKLFKLVSDKYDHVIVDGAPVLGLSDALILANLATSTIFVIQSGETDKHTIISSLNRIKQAKGNIIGTLLTFVDMEKSDYAYNYLEYSAETNKHPPKKGKLSAIFELLKKL